MADRSRAPWVPQKAEERLERSSQILQIRTLILYVTQPKGVRFDPARLPSLRPRGLGPLGSQAGGWPAAAAYYAAAGLRRQVL
jgi:hypothetical protein